MNTQKGFAPILLILLAAVMIGGVSYVYIKNQESVDISNDTIATSTIETDSKQSVPKTIVNTSDTAQIITDIGINDQVVMQALNNAYEVTLQKNPRGYYEAKFPPDMTSNVVVNKIVKGDLNNDNKEDAFVWNTVCGASCGTEFSIVLNDSTRAMRIVPPGLITIGAGQVGVKSITINRGVITITGEMPSSDGSPTPLSTFQYKLSGDSLILVN